MKELLAQSAHEVLPQIEAGELDHMELQQVQFEFARSIDDRLNAFITWDDKVEAQEWDLPLAQEGPARFHRLPYAVKDIFTTKGLQSTAGSRILEGYIPPYSATCVRLLRHEKNHLMGKTNLDEFAMGSSGELSAYGVTHNPWSFEHVPGGSSSGSAVAVAACQSFMALGTDTGGSVRQPAGFCGIVGYRPTYGLVSRYGLIAYASSCDQAGIFTRSTLDSALVMNVISQPDVRDKTCQAAPGTDYVTETQRDLHWAKLRIGVPRAFLNPEAIDAPVLASFRAALDRMSDAGAAIIELDFPLADLSLEAYYIIVSAECSSNLARYDGVRYGRKPEGKDLLERYLNVRSRGLGEEVKRRVLLGTYVLSAGYFDAYYDRARHARADLRAWLDEAMRQVDVLATPTAPCLPFKLGERIDDPIQMYMSDLCTVFVNLTGAAGISVPCGFGEAGGARLPIGLQFVCAPFRDSLLLRVAHHFEQLTGFRYKPPAWVEEALGA